MQRRELSAEEVVVAVRTPDRGVSMRLVRASRYPGSEEPQDKSHRNSTLRKETDGISFFLPCFFKVYLKLTGGPSLHLYGAELQR